MTFILFSYHNKTLDFCFFFIHFITFTFLKFERKKKLQFNILIHICMVFEERIHEVQNKSWELISEKFNLNCKFSFYSDHIHLKMMWWIVYYVV